MLLEIVYQKVGKLIVLESPMRCNEQFLGRLRYEALQNHVRAQTLDIGGYQLDIFIDGIDVKRLLLVLIGQTGAADNLHLVDFQDVDGQAGDDGGLAQTLSRILARQA